MAIFSVKKDSFLSWIICLGAFIASVATIGVDNSFGVVIGSLMEVLDSTTSKIAWIQSIHSSFMFLFAFFSSLMLKTLSFRCVIFTGTFLCSVSYVACIYFENYIGLIIGYGVVGGAGSGILFTPANIACVHYFDKHKAVATGIAMSGGGFGTMGVSLLCNYMNIIYGYKAYFLTICVISSLTIFFAIFASPLQIVDVEEIKKANIDSKNRNDSFNTEITIDQDAAKYQPGNQQDIQDDNKLGTFDISTSLRRSSVALDTHINAIGGSKRKEDMSEAKTRNFTQNIRLLLKDKRMICYCIAHVFFELAYYVPMVFLPEMMIEDQGISKEWAGTIISILGLCHMIGKVLTGLLVQYSKISPIIYSSVSIGIIGVVCIGLTFCTLYSHFASITAIYGLFLSSFDVFLPLVLIEMFGDDKLKDAYGIIMIAKMFSPIWGPPIGGAFKDWKGSYNVAFYASGTFQLIGSLFNALVYLFHWKYRTIQKTTL